MLGKNDVDIAEESIRELVKASSIGDVCKLAEEHYTLNLAEASKCIDHIKQEITKAKIIFLFFRVPANCPLNDFLGTTERLTALGCAPTLVPVKVDA